MSPHHRLPIWSLMSHCPLLLLHGTRSWLPRETAESPALTVSRDLTAVRELQEGCGSPSGSPVCPWDRETDELKGPVIGG